MATSILEMVIGAIIEMGVESIWEATKRREAILGILTKLGFNPDEPPPDFDGLYAYSLVVYGVGKPQPILDLFRHQIIRESFRHAFEQRDRAVFDVAVENFLDSEVGQSLYQIDYDPRQEFTRFEAVFYMLADRARMVTEVRQDQKLDDIHQAVQMVLFQLEQLRELPKLKAEVEHLYEHLRQRDGNTMVVELNDLSREKVNRLLSLKRKDLPGVLAHERKARDFDERTDESHDIQRSPGLANLRLFLSYTEPDAEKVGRFYDKLIADGFDVPPKKWILQ